MSERRRTSRRADEGARHRLDGVHRLVTLSWLVACAPASPPATLQNRRVAPPPDRMTDGPSERACASPIDRLEIILSDDVGIAHDFCASIARSLERHGRALVPQRTLQLAIAFNALAKDGDLDRTCRFTAVLSTTSDQVVARGTTSLGDVDRTAHTCIDRAIDRLVERHVVPAIARDRRP